MSEVPMYRRKRAGQDGGGGGEGIEPETSCPGLLG